MWFCPEKEFVVIEGDLCTAFVFDLLFLWLCLTGRLAQLSLTVRKVGGPISVWSNRHSAANASLPLRRFFRAVLPGR